MHSRAAPPSYLEVCPRAEDAGHGGAHDHAARRALAGHLRQALPQLAQQAAPDGVARLGALQRQQEDAVVVALQRLQHHLHAHRTRMDGAQRGWGTIHDNLDEHRLPSGAVRRRNGQRRRGCERADTCSSLGSLDPCVNQRASPAPVNVRSCLEDSTSLGASAASIAASTPILSGSAMS